MAAGPVVCFGEVLLRLSAPPQELLLQYPRLEVAVGGAEANVAVGLARLGEPVRMVSVLADNPLGQAAAGELRRWGVDTSSIDFVTGRMGLYFLEPGAVLRASKVVYDRAGSAFAQAEPGRFDWPALLAGARWLHVSGVTPAIGGPSAAAALAAVSAANKAGVPVSFDGNYRATLWAERSAEAPAILRELIAGAELAFVDDRDLALALGRGFDAPDPAARRRAAAEAAFAAFPRLTRIASTLRVQQGVDRHDLSGFMFTRPGAMLATEAFAMSGIVDRIGSGDAFAAGLLHGLFEAMPEPRALTFAVASACAKHAVRGDFNLSRVSDIEAIVAGEALDVRR